MKKMLIPAFVILALIAVMFFIPKFMYERGAGTPTPTPIEAYSKKCFGFEQPYQKGEGGMVKHYCLGIAYEVEVRVVETSMFKNSGAEALSVTFVPEKRELEFKGLSYVMYRDGRWDIRSTDTYFDADTGTFYVKLILMKSESIPLGMMVDMSLFFVETVSVPEGTSKVLFGNDEVDITLQIEGWNKSSGRGSEAEYVYTEPAEGNAIGQITMNEDGSLTIDLYADGGGQMQIVVGVGDKDYDMWVTHVGGLVKGEQKLVPPFPR